MKFKIFFLALIATAYASAQSGGAEAMFDKTWNDPAAPVLDTCKSKTGEVLTLKTDVAGKIPFILGVLTKDKVSRKMALLATGGTELEAEEIISGSEKVKRGSFDLASGRLTIEQDAAIILKCDKLVQQ